MPVQKVIGSATAEAEARKRGFRDYDQMRAFVLAQRRGGTTGVVIKGSTPKAAAPHPSPTENAMARGGLMGYVAQRFKQATGGR